MTQNVNFCFVKLNLHNNDNNNKGNIKNDRTDCESFISIKKLKMVR